MQLSFLEPIVIPKIEPVKGYQVIYCDPPWAYGSRAIDDRFRGGAMRHYPVMTTNQICALKIGDIAARSAMLFMWATFPCLPDAFKVINAWGFKYCTVAFNWVKLNSVDNGVFFGVGYYTKSNAEICLLARKGRAIKPAVDTVSQVIVSPKMEHSRKPDEARRRIEQMYPSHSRVELFARRQMPGWDVWGNEVESDLEITT